MPRLLLPDKFNRIAASLDSFTLPCIHCFIVPSRSLTANQVTEPDFIAGRIYDVGAYQSFDNQTFACVHVERYPNITLPIDGFLKQLLRRHFLMRLGHPGLNERLKQCPLLRNL